MGTTVFISYSHDSDAHKETVLGFSERLRRDGFVTSLDQYVNGTPAEGWPRWMQDQVDNASFVLIFCTETYYRRFRGHERPGVGKGADWEGRLITQELYDDCSQSAKFVPILIDSDCEPYIPEPLRGRTFYTLTKESYESLCDFLNGVAGFEPGPVGPPEKKKRTTAWPLEFHDFKTTKPGLELGGDQPTNPPELAPGTLGNQLAKLILGILPHLGKCTGKVRLIAGCKRIHDHLHELLQHVIRPLREEVLSLWAREGKLTGAVERRIGKYMKRAANQETAIRLGADSISPEHRVFHDSIHKLVKWLQWLNAEFDSSDSQVSMAEFTEHLEEFTQVVQDVFTEADQSMTMEESDLRGCYLELRGKLEETRQKCNLKPSDNRRLKQELEKVQANRERVQESLAAHHQWQDAHDTLHELDGFRETDCFGKRLAHYCKFALPDKLHRLVADELSKAENEQVAGTGTIQAGCAASVQSDSSRSSQDCLHPCSLFIDRLKLLKERLEGLRDTGRAAAFDDMRIPFFDAFYCVDKRTLIEVEGAEKRATDLEGWLHRLAMQE